MIRVLIYSLAILHLGPGIAFALIAFGCDPVRPLLGDICGRSTLETFLYLTMIAYLILIGVAFLARATRRPPNAQGGTPLP